MLGASRRGSDGRPGRSPSSSGRSASLSGMVIEREREIRGLTERLREANECHDRSIASLDAVTARLEEMQAQARGQATRIRMKALREAVEVEPPGAGADRGCRPRRPRRAAARRRRQRQRSRPRRRLRRPLRGPGQARDRPAGRFLAAGRLRGRGRPGSAPPRSRSNASPRAARRSRCDSTSRSSCCASWRSSPTLDFKVRHTAPDNLILDVDEDPGPSSAPRKLAPHVVDKLVSRSGAVAQLEERRAGSAKVRGSSPLSSTLSDGSAARRSPYAVTADEYR